MCHRRCPVTQRPSSGICLQVSKAPLRFGCTWFFGGRSLCSVARIHCLRDTFALQPPSIPYVRLDLRPRKKLPGIRSDGSFPAVSNTAVTSSPKKLQKRKTKVRLEPAEPTKVFQRTVQKVQAWGVSVCGGFCWGYVNECRMFVWV